MLATDRSISRAMMSSTIGKTISARSDMSAIACEMRHLFGADLPPARPEADKATKHRERSQR